MKFLFFDIECACVYKFAAKICAFGYVLTDENFQVLEREDVLLNPRGRFHLTDKREKKGIVLPYRYEDFKQYPTFPAQYERLKSLLEDKDHLVCGHATLNDVNYLNLETKRYKLPSFSFEFYDTQFFYMNVKGDFARQSGLGAVAEELKVEFIPHRAVDDAYATMRVCEALCKRENATLPAFLDRFLIRPGRIKDYKIENLTSLGLTKFQNERKEIRAAHSKAHEEFYRYVNKHMNRRKRGGSLEGKVFCFSKDIEEDMETSKKLLEAIFSHGGAYTSHPTECNVYIAREDGEMRGQSALTAGAVIIPFDSIRPSLEEV